MCESPKANLLETLSFGLNIWNLTRELKKVKSMSKRELSEKKLSLPQVKQVLESIGEENLDQFQRRTLDYVSKLTKVNSLDAEFLLDKLTKEYGLDEDEAVQIINCMPESVDELRIFLTGGRKIIETQKLSSIVTLLNEKRTPK